MSIIVNKEKLETQPWMGYRNPQRRQARVDCCPKLITNTLCLLPFQIVSMGGYVKTEISAYGANSWSEITVPTTDVMVEGYYIISYNGEELASPLDCGAYEVRITAGELWWMESIYVMDFEIETHRCSRRTEIFQPFPFYESEFFIDYVIEMQDGEIYPFMFRTLNPTTDPVVYLLDCDCNETELTDFDLEVKTICGYTYYSFDGCPMVDIDCNDCGYFRLKVEDGDFTYFSVPFTMKAGLFDCADTERPEVDTERKVVYDNTGDILCEEACMIIAGSITADNTIITADSTLVTSDSI